MLSSIEHFLSRKSATDFVGFVPNKTCTLARPKSASNKRTFFPVWPSEIARLTAVLVLPTPPLPLVTAIERVIIKCLSYQ